MRLHRRAVSALPGTSNNAEDGKGPRMAVLGTIVMVPGYIVMVVGSIWFLVAAFQTSIGWGLGSLFIPFVNIVFLILHWDVAKRPFLTQLLGIPFIFAGIFLAGSGRSG